MQFKTKKAYVDAYRHDLSFWQSFRSYVKSKHFYKSSMLPQSIQERLFAVHSNIGQFLRSLTSVHHCPVSKDCEWRINRTIDRSRKCARHFFNKYPVWWIRSSFKRWDYYVPISGIAMESTLKQLAIHIHSAVKGPVDQLLKYKRSQSPCHVLVFVSKTGEWWRSA